MRRTPDILAAVRDSKVSVRHDRIYGLLGLIPVRLSIQPDYERSLELVFTEFTLRVIWHERSLDILAIGGLRKARDLALPSWVPSYDDAAPYLFRGTSGFDASKALATEPQIGFPEAVANYVGSGRLSVWIHELGRLSLVTSSVPEHVSAGLLEGDPQERARHIDALQQLTCECLLKLKEIGAPDATVQDIAGHMWSALIGQVNPDSNGCQQRLGNDFKAWVFLRGEERYQHKYQPVIRTLLATRLCPLFAVRGTNFVGIVSGAALSGDVLAILFGASTPCIIRRKDDGTCQYVGHTYCIGAMHGETVSQAAALLNGNENDLSGIFQSVELA